MDPDAAVAEYLEALEAAAAGLDPERRADLVDEVREHIGLALADAGASDETTVREVLDRLGSPVEIVAAESGAQPPLSGNGTPLAETHHEERRPLTGETRALLWLTLGAVVLPFLGPVLGLWIAAASKRWSLTQKRTATLMVLVLLVPPFMILTPALISGEITWVFTSGGFLLPFVPLSGILAAVYLVTSTSVVFSVSRRQ